MDLFYLYYIVTRNRTWAPRTLSKITQAERKEKDMNIFSLIKSQKAFTLFLWSYENIIIPRNLAFLSFSCFFWEAVFLGDIHMVI